MKKLYNIHLKDRLCSNGKRLKSNADEINVNAAEKNSLYP